MCSMIKLVVADCDGTILDDHKKIDNQLKEVIKKLEEKNVIFTLASGRNKFLMEEVVQALDLEYPYIINNGANIYQKNKMIENYSLPKDAVQPICSILENENFPFLAYSEKELVIYSKHQLLDGFKEKLKNKCEHVEFNASTNYSNVPFFKITIATDNVNDIEETKKRIEELFPTINFKRSEGTLFTITSNEATKGNAIKTLASMFGINNDEVMVFGDNYNDITMFDVASVGVAMGNSDETIKQCATHETSDNNHHGVSEFLKKYFGL